MNKIATTYFAFHCQWKRHLYSLVGLLQHCPYLSSTWTKWRRPIFSTSEGSCEGLPCFYVHAKLSGIFIGLSNPLGVDAAGSRMSGSTRQRFSFKWCFYFTLPYFLWGRSFSELRDLFVVVCEVCVGGSSEGFGIWQVKRWIVFTWRWGFWDGRSRWWDCGAFFCWGRLLPPLNLLRCTFISASSVVCSACYLILLWRHVCVLIVIVVQ